MPPFLIICGMVARFAHAVWCAAGPAVDSGASDGGGGGVPLAAIIGVVVGVVVLCAVVVSCCLCACLFGCGWGSAASPP